MDSGIVDSEISLGHGGSESGSIYTDAQLCCVVLCRIAVC